MNVSAAPSLFDIRHDKALPSHVREAANAIYKYSEGDRPGDLEILVGAIQNRIDAETEKRALEAGLPRPAYHRIKDAVGSIPFAVAFAVQEAVSLRKLRCVIPAGLLLRPRFRSALRNCGIDVFWRWDYLCWELAW